MPTHSWGDSAFGRKASPITPIRERLVFRAERKPKNPATCLVERFIMDTTKVDDSYLHGIVLAAGEGKRLQQYVQEIRGEALPKQYVNLIGRRSMLEHTFHRAERLIPAEKILTVVSRRHLLRAEVCRQVARRPRENLIVQPANKETGPGILLPLMFIYKRCPQAIVAVFPSDHFVLEENRFMSHVDLAVQAAKHDLSRIILLAIEPHEPE